MGASEERRPVESPTRAIACECCDALLSVPRSTCAVIHCPRCRSVVLRRVVGGPGSALACYLAACIFFAVANCFPIVQIEAAGNSVQATLIGAALALHAEHMNLIAILVALTTVVIPGVELFCTTSVLLLAESRHHFGTLASIFRLRQALKPWNMLEILMLGALVAVVKLGSIASVVLGTGIWALAAFMIAHAAASHVFDPKDFWKDIKRPP